MCGISGIISKNKIEKNIIEPMSCHIPIVAPDIGGIKDMVIDGINGFLLSSDFKIDELVLALSEIEFFKNKKNRNASYDIFLDKYDAKNNYTNFIRELIELR